MESNREEAYRAKEFAEKKFHAQDLGGAKKLALKAQRMCPSIEGLAHLIALLDVHLAAHIKISGIPDWYAVLQVDSTVEESLIKKHYRKLALLLHPDKNKSPGAEEAFKLIGEASRVLSNSASRAAYDLTRKSSDLSPQQPPLKTKKRKPPKDDNNASSGNNCDGFSKRAGGVPSFWTHCSSCGMHFEFSIEYMERFIICPSCKNLFMAFRIPYDPTSRAPPHQRANSGSEGKENEKTPQMPNQSKGSQVPRKEGEPNKGKSPQMPNQCKGSQVPKKKSEPKKEKSPQMPKQNKGSQIPTNEGEPRKGKSPQMPNQCKGSQVPKKKGESNKEKSSIMPNQNKRSQVPTKEGEPKNGKSPQMPNQSKGSQAPRKEGEPKKGKSAQMPKPSNEFQWVPRKEGEPKKGKSPQMPNQFKGSQVPTKGGEPKKAKSPQMLKASNEGSQVPTENWGSNHAEKEESKKIRRKQLSPSWARARIMLLSLIEVLLIGSLQVGQKECLTIILSTIRGRR